MKKQNIGLIAAIAIGVAFSLFPFYGSSVAGLLWKPGSGGESVEEKVGVEGVVEAVDTARGVVVVDGREVLVKGWWRLDTGETLYYSDLVGMLSPGTRVSIEAKVSEKWGLMAERIEFNGHVAVKE